MKFLSRYHSSLPFLRLCRTEGSVFIKPLKKTLGIDLSSGLQPRGEGVFDSAVSASASLRSPRRSTKAEQIDKPLVQTAIGMMPICSQCTARPYLEPDVLCRPRRGDVRRPRLGIFHLAEGGFELPGLGNKPLLAGVQHVDDEIVSEGNGVAGLFGPSGARLRYGEDFSARQPLHP